jgi:hypothetical protein
MADNISTVLLDRRRDHDAHKRFIEVEVALRLWRRALIAEMSGAEFAPDSENTETLLDLYHGELEECGHLMTATVQAAERMMERRGYKRKDEDTFVFDEGKAN